MTLSASGDHALVIPATPGNSGADDGDDADDGVASPSGQQFEGPAPAFLPAPPGPGGVEAVAASHLMLLSQSQG